MKKYFIRCLILHFSICAAYFLATSYEFVATKQPDPIGIGIQQLLCIFLQVIITLGYFMVIPWRGPDRKQYNTKILINIGAIVLAVAVIGSIDELLSDKLWSLHDR